MPMSLKLLADTHTSRSEVTPNKHWMTAPSGDDPRVSERSAATETPKDELVN
jgi:hypothetical protein